MRKVDVKCFINLIQEKSFLEDFKFRNRDTSLIKKTKQGFEMIEFQIWENKEQLYSNNNFSVIVKPLYLKRFNVLHKWFERFSFKSIIDQRDNYSIGFDGGQLKGRDEFILNEENFENDFKLLKKNVEKNSKLVFNKFRDIEDIYDYSIKPLLSREANFPNVGADWIFEYLSIVKIVNEEELETFNNILYPHITEMYQKKEPNIIEYYSRYNEILSYLKESL